MPRLLHLGNRAAIYIEDTAFAGGGEGDIYRIMKPANYSHYVVKLYKPAKRTAERAQKIAHLIANPPFSLDVPRQALAWAREVVYENGNFAGLVMPAVQGIKLEMLCQPKLPANLGKEWQRLALGQPEAMTLRLKLCYNIALAVLQVHHLNKYALIDLKADNMLVQPNGIVALIDTDSLAVFADEQLRFAAPVVTPDFAPPEYYRGANPSKFSTAYAWDNFSLAVLFYRILCGIHPYTGTCEPPLDHLNDLSSKVAQGLFVQGKHRPQYTVVPPPHTNFEQLPPDIRRLFLRCFDDGHQYPDRRPQPDEWHRALLTHLAQLPLDYPLPSKLISIPIPTPTTLLRPSSKALERLFAESVMWKTRISNPNNTNTYLARRDNLERQYRQSIAQLDAHQTEQLRREAKAIRQAVGTFKQRLLALDRQSARAYQIQMAEEQRISIELSDQLTRLELPAQRYRETQVKTAEMPFKQQISPFAQQLISIEEQEKSAVAALEALYMPKLAANERAMTTLLNKHTRRLTIESNKQLRKIATERKKLQKQAQKALEQCSKTWLCDYVWQEMNHYLIANYAHSIFGGTVAQPRDMALLLARYGIATAADFVSITPAGGIKVRATGKTLKVPGLGGKRGSSLLHWQRRIKDSLTMQIQQYGAQYAPTAAIQQQYDKLLQDLDIQTQRIQLQTERAKQAIGQEIQVQKQKILTQKQQIRKQIEQKLAILRDNFRTRRQPIITQIAAIKQQCLQATISLRETLEKLERDAAQQRRQLTQQAEKQKQSRTLQYELLRQKAAKAEAEQWQQTINTIQQQTAQTLAQYAQQADIEWQSIAQKLRALQREWNNQSHIYYR
jgi:serine/threonine protein kinase